MSSDDRDKLTNEVSRGQHAESFLSNPIYVEFGTVVRDTLFDEFCKTQFKDAEERDEIWRKMQTLGWLEAKMKRTARDGRQAEKTLLQRIKDKIK